MDYLKYLRDRAAEMGEFALTATEPASSEFFKLASLCRDSADRVERQLQGEVRVISGKADARNPVAPSTSLADTRLELTEPQSG